jgi:DNA-binding IclR family transcriptional regulator
MTDDEKESSGQIPTNLRLLLLLEEVAKAGVPVTPSAVNEVLGLPKPTIHRLFATAEAEGFLQRDLDGRSYSPGRRMRLLSINTLSSERVRTVRLAILKSLALRVGETCNLAIPERDGMFYLDRVETHWPLRIQLPVGTQVPFHCTASGKMYLSTLRHDYLERFLKNHALEKQTDRTITDPTALQAELELTRERGYSTDNEEFMMGMTAIAVPILDDRGRLMSTLSIHAPEQRSHLPDLVEYLEPLRAAAAELAAIVGR